MFCMILKTKTLVIERGLSKMKTQQEVPSSRNEIFHNFQDITVSPEHRHVVVSHPTKNFSRKKFLNYCRKSWYNCNRDASSIIASSSAVPLLMCSLADFLLEQARRGYFNGLPGGESTTTPCSVRTAFSRSKDARRSPPGGSTISERF